jgi:glutamate N-acetyltransferase/amino-acid N-acetyltransferase
MSDLFEFIENGSPTSVPGFKASGVVAGFKRSGAPDFALLYSDTPADAAGVFTTCRFAAAPVRYCRELLAEGTKLRAVVINSGIANACTGKQGLEASRKTAALAAAKLGVEPGQVAVASTGRIGTQMNMDIISRGLELAVPALSSDGGNDAARAIMTTDTVPKAAAVKAKIGGTTVTIGAMTKGAGMINPGLAGLHATMLCFITTDACVDRALLAEMLEENAQNSFNRITVDGDMSTNDTVLLLANGASGVVVRKGSAEAEVFKEALLAVMKNLARRMVKDGEGSTKLVTIEVVNARSLEDAKLAAESVANSLLCKTAWFGNDPNWGRIAAALGYSGAVFDPDKCDISIDGLPVMTQGGDAGTPESAAVEKVKKPEFTIRCDFHDGSFDYWVWSSDVSYDYVKINADYHT